MRNIVDLSYFSPGKYLYFRLSAFFLNQFWDCQFSRNYSITYLPKNFKTYFHIFIQEFIDAMHQFAGQSPDDKIKFLFKVYDIDGEIKENRTEGGGGGKKVKIWAGESDLNARKESNRRIEFAKAFLEFSTIEDFNFEICPKGLKTTLFSFFFQSGRVALRQKIFRLYFGTCPL